METIHLYCLNPWKHLLSRIWKFRAKEKDTFKSKPTANNLVLWHGLFETQSSVTIEHSTTIFAVSLEGYSA